MSGHFYLTLPSAPDVARYVTKLPQSIRLDGDYEVGLSEIVYPHTWNNVDNKQEIYWIGEFDLATSKLTKTYIKSGYYCDGDAFAASLTHQATRTFAHLNDISVKFSFVKHAGRIRMQVRNSNEHIVVISWDLMEFLGFREKVIAKKEADLIGAKAFDVNRGLNLMYVYCDVAAHGAVGDAKAPLLRVCNVSGQHGRIVHVTYDRPHYVPVGRREFDAIEIAINNERGDPMPFEFGNSMVTLHFRRR